MDDEKSEFEFILDDDCSSSVSNTFQENNNQSNNQTPRIDVTRRRYNSLYSVSRFGRNCFRRKHLQNLIAMIMGDPLVNLFDTLEPKSAPLYSCNSWIDGIKYRIPKKMDCPLVDTEKPSAIVNVTLWFEDISVLKVTASVYEWFF